MFERVFILPNLNKGIVMTAIATMDISRYLSISGGRDRLDFESVDEARSYAEEMRQHPEYDISFTVEQRNSAVILKLV
jgi:hypothetical protein